MGTLFVMEGRYLRSISLHAGEETQKQDLTRVKTLKRHLMKTLKRQNTVIGTTLKNGTTEFDVNTNNNENASQVMNREYATKDLEKFTSDKDDDFNCNVKTTNTKKGILWQQSGSFFSSWQERFYVLTENSLYSFPQGCKTNETLAAATKIRLCELSDVELLNQKGQLVLKLQLCKKSAVLLRKPEGLTDWYENILDNVQMLKMKPMENSRTRSLIADSDIKKNPCSLRISQPNMGVNSLRYRKQNMLSK